MSSFCLFFVLLVAAFVKNGTCDPTTEANLLALEASGELLAPKYLTKKLTRELKAIRTAYPNVSNIVYTPPWTVGVLLVEVSDEQLEKIRIQYGDVTTSSPLYAYADYKILRFKTQYNPKILAKELTSKRLVESAEAGSDYDDYSSSIHYNAQTGVYKFTKGWGDCPAECMFNHYWKFFVFRTKVILLREHGTPLDADYNNYEFYKQRS